MWPYLWPKTTHECKHSFNWISSFVLALIVLALTVLALIVLALTVLALIVLALIVLALTVLALIVLALTVLALTVLALFVLALTVLALIVLAGTDCPGTDSQTYVFEVCTGIGKCLFSTRMNILNMFMDLVVGSLLYHFHSLSAYQT